MRLVEINAYNIGSTGRIMLQIAECTRRNGWEAVTFSSSRESVKPASEGHCFIDCYPDYRLHMGFGMIFGFELEFSYLATIRLIRTLNKIRPEVIHIHNTHGWYLNHDLFFRYLKKSGAKVVWTLHDCWTFTGRCPHFQMTKCEKWLTGCRQCSYDKRLYPASYLFDRSRRNWKKKKRLFTGISDLTIVTPSHWLADLVKQSFLKKYPVRVIHNGLDLAVFRPVESDFRNKYRCENRRIVLGVVFSWGRRKGLDVWIELSKRMNETYQIVLVGTNDEIDGLLPETILSVHKTDTASELAEIYSTADVFVNPTREDTFPTTNLEALACGTPVVTFQTGGATEMLDDSCGVAVPCDDVDAMEREIVRICETGAYRSEDCRRRAQDFDKEKKYREYIELFEEIHGKK